MKCETSDREQRVDDFLQEKLLPEEAEAFERHLFGCPECLAEMRVRERMLKLIKEERTTAVAQLQGVQSPVFFFGAIADFFGARPSAWTYAGIAAVLLTVILISTVFRPKSRPDAYAANFAPVPQLENLLAQSQRSSGFSISVNSPRVGENFTGEVSFRWQIEKDGEDFAEPLDLKILDNRETLKHEARLAGKEYRLSQPMVPGLYYWTLEYQGEMLYLGKFFVNRPSH